MNIPIYCKHEWEEKGNTVVCKLCGKTKLKLTRVNDNLSTGIRKDGTIYSVRSDRLRYFNPIEWRDFYEQLREQDKLIFDFLIKTGARIEEALLFKSEDLLDDQRHLIKLYVTKRKAKKQGEEKGKPRTFVVATSLYNKLKQMPKGFIFIKAPNNLDRTEANRKELRRYVNARKIPLFRTLKNILKKAGIKDFYNFSFHNLRKTHGMWLKRMMIHSNEITEGEICMRLGHDLNTFLKHYGSPSIFNSTDDKLIVKYLGDIYSLK
jgi:integrase